MVSCMGNDVPWLGVDIHSPSTGMGHSLRKMGYKCIIKIYTPIYGVVYKRKKVTCC